MTITLSEKEVVARRNAVPNLLAPLRRNGTRVGCDFSGIAGPRVLAAHEGGSKRQNSGLQLFRTFVRPVWAEYFEVWHVARGGTVFELHKAYLHLYLIAKPDAAPDQLLALHADPADGHRYKKGPHVHVVKSEDPLPHCHFSLNLDRIDQVSSTIKSLDGALTTAVMLVADEVLGAYQAFLV